MSRSRWPRWPSWPSWIREAWHEALQTRAARLAVLALVSMAALAAWAPLLASDQPWRLAGRFRGECRDSIALLAPLSGELELARATQDGQRIAAASQALELRFALLENNLGAAAAAAIAGWRAAGGGGIAALAAELGGLPLASRVRWPLFERLPASDGALAGLFAGLAVLWLPRVLAGQRARRGLAAWLAACAGLGALVPLAPRATGAGGGPCLPLVDVKGQIARGAIEVDGVWWAPLAFGFAEAHPEESFRAPTWCDSGSEFVSSAGSAARAVEVRPGEPPADAWSRHLAGTDGLGRDLLARSLWGARASLAIGLSAAAILLSVGTAVGMLAGWLGGALERAALRAIDVVQCFPSLILVLIAAAWCSPRGSSTAGATALVLGLTSWTGVARLARAECARLVAADWALVARSQGLSGWRIALVHVLPNAAPPLLVQGVAAVSWALVAESSLSFLGFGVRAPGASWGGILGETRQLEHWWCLVFPGLLLFTCTLSASVLGEALRRALDPRQRSQAEPAPGVEQHS